MRRIVPGVIALVALFIAGCGGGGGGKASGGTDGSLARVQKAGKLVICSSNDVPYAYKDPNSGQLTGTDVDQVRVIAQMLKVPKIELYQVPISGIIAALNTSRCDMIADNIAITSERAQQIAFSSPMYRAGQALVVPKGNPAHITSQADFHGHSVGSYLEYLRALAKKDPTIKVKAYKDIPEIIADLRAHRLDAAAFDGMVADYSIKKNPSLGIEVVPYKLPIGDYAVGAGFRKSDKSLRDAFDDADRQVQMSGQLNSILSKWGMVPVQNYWAFPNCCTPASP
jgi:polar amino acid transport system substrate-binding protein